MGAGLGARQNERFSPGRRLRRDLLGLSSVGTHEVRPGVSFTLTHARYIE
jgi:hypothetical protein